MALTKDRNTKMKEIGRAVKVPVAAAAVIYNGAMVATNATGYLVPAADTAGLQVVGIAQEQCNNAAGANGALECQILKGVAGMKGSSITQAEVGRTVTVVDDETIGKAADTTNDVIAGTLDRIEGAIYWVKLHDNA